MNQIIITTNQDLAVIDTSTQPTHLPLQKCLIQSGMFLNRYAYILPHSYIPPSLLNDYTSRRVALVFRHDLTTLYWLEKENILPLSDIPHLENTFPSSEKTFPNSENTI